MTTQTKSQREDTIAPPNDQFLFAEYHEAASSYANGVEIGFNTIKAFFAINGVLITIHQTPLSLVADSEIVGYLQDLAPVFGVMVSIILALFIPPYFRHLNNCLRRCCEIEAIYGGKLFNGNQRVADRKLNTKTVLFFFATVPLAMWGYQLYLSLS